MKQIEKKKQEIFLGILASVNRQLPVNSSKEAAIVSMTYEKTFDLLNKLIDSELRKSYLKKTKYIKKASSSRLASID